MIPTSQPTPPTLTPPIPPTPAYEPRPQSRLGRVRLRQWYGIGGLVLSLLVLAAMAQSILALQEIGNARTTLLNHVTPATLQAFQLNGALAAQDTAIRDYAATGEARFVTTYRRAIATEAQTEQQIQVLLRDVPNAAPVRNDLGRLMAASATWRRDFADPLTVDGKLAREESRTGSRLFGEVRNTNGAVQQGLGTLNAQVDQNLRERVRNLYLSMGISSVVIGLAALTLVLLIRRTVLQPVARLGEQSRRVAQGEFAHPLDISGPAELSELAAIVDSMRHRIIQEWRHTAEARARLDEQAAELRRSNAELEQFAYVASHDLQEPLRKVASFCQMIERRYSDRLDDRGRQYIDFAVDGAKRMQALINDLLTFSRVGRFTKPEEAVSLDAVLERATDNLTRLIEETGAEVVADDLPEVPGDRTLLTQLFQNLIGNAIKFRSDERPRVVVGARCDGDMWELSCADNGIGIEPRYADRIFLIFQRLHPQDEYTGTGIGLAMCKKIVEHHGGHIWLDTEQEPGHRGTTIRWTLPAVGATDRAGSTDCKDDDERADAQPDRGPAGGGRPR
ncbi:sensor histidine kinase [Actinomadura craniellae]|uniref:histidine kinase n=1 Tax=Actinomadura craniellae TaxID=2231787 RepID=A0A365H851_9ACTN|nr:ATP-binding protein [Actinomadura craniellae]RAY14443.1 sensor histidine kinase [Actinomadura craniellae]